jgi:protein involved in polysaccharide export with SLBB domain
VLDAILAVGGVTEFAAPKRARIVRTEGGDQQEIRVRLGDVVDKGDLDENVRLPNSASARRRSSSAGSASAVGTVRSAISNTLRPFARITLSRIGRPCSAPSSGA